MFSCDVKKFVYARCSLSCRIIADDITCLFDVQSQNFDVAKRFHTKGSGRENGESFKYNLKCFIYLLNDERRQRRMKPSSAQVASGNQSDECLLNEIFIESVCALSLTSPEQP